MGARAAGYVKEMPDRTKPHVSTSRIRAKFRWCVLALLVATGVAACNDDSSQQDAPPESTVLDPSRADSDVAGVGGATWPDRPDPGVPASNLGALDGQAPYNESDALPPREPTDE